MRGFGKGMRARMVRDGIPGGRFGGPFEDGFGGGFGGGRGRGFGGFGGGRGGRGGDGDGDDRRGLRGGRRGKRFDGEELKLVVLGLLAQEPQHGYQLIRAFADKSGGAYQPSPGVLYPLLTMLAEMGLVAEVAGDEGSSRRRYELTEAGQAELEANAEKLALLLARLKALAELAGRTDGAAPVRRAVHNLRAAVIERLGREGTPAELAFDVAAIIDEATQKIERL